MKKSTRAARRKSRARPRRPKFIEVEGHKLTPEQDAQWREARAKRLEHNDPDNARRLGLEDFLWRYRPTGQMGERALRGIYNRLTGANSALGAMLQFPFYARGTPRAAGCTTLRELAGEYERTANMLYQLAGAMDSESSTKLQDWLVFSQALVERP